MGFQGHEIKGFHLSVFLTFGLGETKVSLGNNWKCSHFVSLFSKSKVFEKPQQLNKSQVQLLLKIKEELLKKRSRRAKESKNSVRKVELSHTMKRRQYYLYKSASKSSQIP